MLLHDSLAAVKITLNQWKLMEIDSTSDNAKLIICKIRLLGPIENAGMLYSLNVMFLTFVFD